MRKSTKIKISMSVGILFIIFGLEGLEAMRFLFVPLGTFYSTYGCLVAAASGYLYALILKGVVYKGEWVKTQQPPFGDRLLSAWGEEMIFSFLPLWVGNYFGLTTIDIIYGRFLAAILFAALHFQFRWKSLVHRFFYSFCLSFVAQTIGGILVATTLHIVINLTEPE